jgi:UDP-N-acetylglucosamine 1-carboxyvinyltransferase
MADGVSWVTEGVWDNRYRYMNELRKMGAEVEVDGRSAVISGVPHLTGATVTACDLRAGAAMVIAGLCAEGTTTVEDVIYIERGYQDIVGKLRRLGADIVAVSDPEPESVPKTAFAG